MGTPLLPWPVPLAWREAQTVLLVSLDGFRWDYLELHPELTPNLRGLVAAGSSAERMTPVSPSKTLASHWSLITGLTPEQHGIMENYFLDPQGRRFDARTAQREGHWWQHAEPLWVTAERQGVRTAPIFWPGSGATARGVDPSYRMVFDVESKELADFGAELREIQRLLALPAPQRPRMLTAYWDGVDHAGHKFGPGSEELRRSLREADARVGWLVAWLRASGWYERLNLVVVSDHGMRSLRRGCTLDLRALLSSRQLQHLDLSHPASKLREGVALLQLRPKASLTPNRRTRLLAALLRALSPSEAAPQVASARAWPAGARAAGQAVWLTMRCGCQVSLSPAKTEAAEGEADERPGSSGATVEAEAYGEEARGRDRGNHGYDPPSCGGAHQHAMDAIFIAHGPAFRPSTTVPPFSSLAVYGLLCRVLGLAPSPEYAQTDQAPLRAASALLRTSIWPWTPRRWWGR